MRIPASMLTSLLLGAPALFSATAALPLGQDETEMLFERETAVEEMHQNQARASTYAVTGVTGNGVQTRMELRTMQQQHPDIFNVYLLGLTDFHANTVNSDQLSFYQIAGIHGRPYLPWDQATSPDGSDGYGGGYCTHTSNLFLTWHRPYLALYEQVLQKHIQTVVNRFPAGSRRTRYQTAANQFRIPYWDWAMVPCSTCSAYPKLVSEKYTTVDSPTGTQTMINPLFRYDFHPISAADMKYNPFATWTSTKRDPTSDDANATSRDDLVATQIANGRASYQSRLYNLFQMSNFSRFSNEAWITSTTNNADSLESLHDVIHATVGSGGHMTYLDYAAFDPIFWLHHVMIDRAFALYQVLYPNSYVQPLAEPGSTYTYPAGTVQDVNSALSPFHKDTAGTNWNSVGIKSTTTLNYSYPETANGATISTVKAAINKLYGSGATASTKKRDLNSTANVASVEASATGGEISSYEYSASIVSQKFQMNGTYGVYVFFGSDISDSPEDWGVAENLVGVHAVFSNLYNEDSVQQMSGMDLKITGSVPLTNSLANQVESGALASLNPSDVETFLTSNLDWRVAMYDGTFVELENVPDLSVTVVGTEITKATSDDEFPTWGTWTGLSNVTRGRPGGHNDMYWEKDGRHRDHHSRVGDHISNGLAYLGTHH